MYGFSNDGLAEADKNNMIKEADKIIKSLEDEYEIDKENVEKIDSRELTTTWNKEDKSFSSVFANAISSYTLYRPVNNKETATRAYRVIVLFNLGRTSGVIKRSEVLSKLKKLDDENQKLNEEKIRLKTEIETLNKQMASMFAECPQCHYPKYNYSSTVEEGSSNA
jgi:cell division protein FtsB